MKHIVLFLPFIFASSLFAGEKLRLIGEYNIATGEKFKETEIGGLSGIVFDAKKNHFFVVSDDKSVINNSRFYEFSFVLDEKKFSLAPFEVTILKNKEGQPFKKMAEYFKGISFWGDDLLIVSEGKMNREPPINPEFIRFNRDGTYKENLVIPDKFLPSKTAELKQGARDNLVFEALSTTKDGKFVFLGTEEALYQDGRTSTPNFASTTRIILYTDLKPTKEYGYLLEKVPAISVGGLTIGETGLVDIAAIDDKNFYSMERSHLPLAKKNIVRIFKNQINESTTEISQLVSISDKKIIPVSKVLVSDFEEFSLKLDNLDGFCFGPTLPNGHQTLIAVSDNNFSKTQRTQFLAFEILP